MRPDSDTADGLHHITNEAAVGLPPLQWSRKAVWDYYRIEFLPDGYPGRQTAGVLYAHPIYGPYVVSDYLAQYRRTKNEHFLAAAMRVADAAVARMTPVGDGLAFIYSQEKSWVSSRGGTFYSGLTQARYIEMLSKLVVLPGGERFSEALSGVVRSLLLPAHDGGVARWTAQGGLIIEEYPSVLPDCTLNGWTTATCILRDYALRTGNPEAWDVFHHSVRGLEQLIMLYDVPELANSRYRLTGTATIQVTPHTDLEVVDCSVEMPGHGTFPASRAGDPPGEALAGGVRRLRQGESVTFDVSLSRITWPAPNRVVLSVASAEAGSLTVGVGDGRYSPMAKNLPVEFYRDLGAFAVEAGQSRVEVAIPWVDAELISYPTGFGKAIASRQFNQYHWIHVDTLSKIIDQTASDVLSYYRDRWERYPARWPHMDEYADERITLERFDPRRHK